MLCYVTNFIVLYLQPGVELGLAAPCLRKCDYSIQRLTHSRLLVATPPDHLPTPAVSGLLPSSEVILQEAVSYTVRVLATDNLECDLGLAAPCH